MRIVQVSDTHLSRSHGYFAMNFAAFRDAMRADPPALIVHSGDLSFNGPKAADDLRYSAACMNALGVAWRGIAGNHDVGEAPAHSRLDQPVDAARLAEWHRHVGPSWWFEDVGGWRLVGLDTALMASERPEEAAQRDFLTAALATRGGRPVMVFMHMPPFFRDPADPQRTTHAVPFPARMDLLDLCAEGGVKVIACGHLHIYHRTEYRGMEIVWAPATAMVAIERGLASHGRAPRPGYLEWRLDADTATHRLIEPERMMVIDMTGWTSRNGSTVTNLPPLPDAESLEIPAADAHPSACPQPTERR
jgi:3',5'-cyclic AMP phosphodiesterase CpdA